MADKPLFKYRQPLESFDDYYTDLMQYVWEHGKFSVEFLSKREMMGERLKIYRFRSSMRAFKPTSPLTAFMEDVEIRIDEKRMVMELVHRPNSNKTMKTALAKARKGGYTHKAVDAVADATSALEESLARDRANYDGVDDEGKQGNSNE